MGEMRFLVPDKEHLPADSLQWAFLDGIDGVPWRSRFRWEENELIVELDVEESGCFHLPWNVIDKGPLTLQTASLVQRATPYLLPVELARGNVNRLRNFVAEWQLAGYPLPPQVTEYMKQATRLFIQAATQQSDIALATQESYKAIKHSTDGIQLLTEQFAQRSLAQRLEKSERLPTMLAGTLPYEGISEQLQQTFKKTFNSAAVSVNWRLLEPNPGKFEWEELDRQIEWCHRAGLRVCVGPLVQLDREHLPDWIYLWEDSYAELQSNAVRMVDAVVRRYRDRVQIWHCASRLNLNEGLALDEQERLMLAVAILRTIHSVDTSSPVVISFDRPWGEYLAHEHVDLSPLHFADELVRAETGLRGLGLEMNLGFSPGCTPFRDLLELNRQIDRWSSLGLPLLLSLTIPGSSGATRHDATQSSPSHPQANPWHPSLDFQRQMVEELFPLLLAKTSIHGVIWKQLLDPSDGKLPAGGLFFDDHQEKPGLKAIQGIRSQYLR